MIFRRQLGIFVTETSWPIGKEQFYLVKTPRLISYALQNGPKCVDVVEKRPYEKSRLIFDDTYAFSSQKEVGPLEDDRFTLSKRHV